ncbi:MAG: hypothetical protein LAO20_13880 [Acidobacteriia bacterium]|nr:hypothetical protein [Terriglobia bacterium]
MRHSLRLLVLCIALCLTTIPAFAQVQTVGDVSFAVPAGWTYTTGPDFGAMVYKEDNRFWLVSVYTSMPSSGNPDQDFKAAWQRVVLAIAGFRGVPGYNPYSISKPLGYAGKYYDDSNTSGTAYARLYALQTGKSCVPVVFISGNRQMLDGMGHMEAAILGSVRAAPAKATPIQLSAKVGDLTGEWHEGLAFSQNYYSRSTGQYVTSTQTFYSAVWNIGANGRYDYKMGGMMNSRPVNDNDTGVVELADGFVMLKGQKHQRRYRFVYLLQALDGSTVLALFPDVEMAQINSNRDITFWTRSLKK